MAACDVTELITNAAPYTAENLGGAKRQKAMAVWAVMRANSTGTSDALINTAIQNTVTKLGPATDDQIRAALVNMLLAAATRAGVSVGSFATQISQADYLFLLDEKTLDKLFLDQLCSLLSTLLP